MPSKQQGEPRCWLTSKPAPWFSTAETLEYLGISNEELNEQLGRFELGVHYKYEKPNDKNSRILWRIDLIDETLCLPIPPLEREAMFNAINNHITCQE